ncbi:MAG TPA: GNAT family N-acetyltransferase [Candidatus Dormibacteraeota bacterium]|nr:GNAT family N-acetyltransferase [Candidatus Dormibacteraeota bacterium]
MIRELVAGETGLASAALLALRPQFGSGENLAAVIDGVQRAEGYRLVASFADGDEQAAAAAGFRVINHLAWGHAMYCDDLSTRLEHRRAGHAGLLVDWMIDEAIRLECGEFHLDSATAADRADAHRLYMNKGMRIAAHHFQRTLR